MYQILSIRRIGEPNAAIYPIPDRIRDAVLAEDADGGEPTVVTATALSVSELQGCSPRSLARERRTRAIVAVSDCRLTVACSDYASDRDWISTSERPISALDSSDVDRAAREGHGRMLVGQVRFEWLESVGLISKRGIFGAEHIRLTLRDGWDDSHRLLALDLTFPRRFRASALVTEVIERYASYWLGLEVELPRERLDLLVQMRSGLHVPKCGSSTEFAMQRLPCSVPVGFRLDSLISGRGPS